MSIHEQRIVLRILEACQAELKGVKLKDYGLMGGYFLSVKGIIVENYFSIRDTIWHLDKKKGTQDFSIWASNKDVYKRQDFTWYRTDTKNQLLRVANPAGSLYAFRYINAVSYTHLNIAYGKKWKPAVFLGYLKNLGTSDEISKMYGTGTNVDQLVSTSA